MTIQFEEKAFDKNQTKIFTIQTHKSFSIILHIIIVDQHNETNQFEQIKTHHLELNKKQIKFS